MAQALRKEQQHEQEPRDDKSLKRVLTFLLPSIIGIILFIIPIPYNDAITIPIAILAGLLQGWMEDSIPAIMTGIIILTTLGSILMKTVRPEALNRSPFFKALLDVTPVWFIARIIGAIFAVMVFFQLGPEMIWSEYTGGLLLYDLLPVLLAVFLFAGMFLPLLLDFGLLELVGTLLTKVMRPIFNLPGRSSVNAIASWLGDGTIGVLLTSKQYEEGYYTKREAAMIATSFSAVSITFSLVVISQIGLAHMFIPFYLTVTGAGLICAVIMGRIPPLSRKEDTYYVEKSSDYSEDEIPEGYTPLSWGYAQALEKAGSFPGIKSFFIAGSKNVLDMWMGVAPIIMAMGTLALIIAEYTPVFQWLGAPFIPLLELLQIPEATAASQTFVLGFADMFLPSVIGVTIESEMTRFIIASVSVTQLIYMSETGGLLLGSKLPINLWDLILIFILRTLITLPIITLVAHIIF